MLSAAGRVWSTTQQRERETDLLFIGHAYRMAISSYFASGHQYPATLKDLVLDERYPVPVHHLRRIYADPMTGSADWTLILTPTGQGIMGVASSSQHAPIKRRGFDPLDETFKDADCYCAWRFIYYPNRFTRDIPAMAPLKPLQPAESATPPAANPPADSLPTATNDPNS